MDEMDETGLNLSYYFCGVMKKEKKIHIGKIIQAQLKADKRSVSWLAQEIGCTRGHIYKIFLKPSLDSDLILSISIAMGFNFFKYYSAVIQASIKARIGED